MITSLLFAAPLLLAGGGQAPTFQFMKDKPMPQFVLHTIDGQKITNKSLKGKIVVFDFWATWCGPCKMASPAMQKLYASFHKQGVMIIGADTFENEPGPKGAKEYKAAHKFGYTFTYENDGLAHSLGIGAIPAFALVDRKGVIREAVAGVPPGGPDAIYAYFSKRINGLK